MRATILILEPRAPTLSLLRRTIEAIEGPILAHAETIEAAVDILRLAQVEMVFVDVGFAAHVSIDFIGGIRRERFSVNRRLPLIAFGRPRADLVQSAARAGASGYLATPFSQASVQIQIYRARQDARGDVCADFSADAGRSGRTPQTTFSASIAMTILSIWDREQTGHWSAYETTTPNAHPPDQFRRHRTFTRFVVRAAPLLSRRRHGFAAYPALRVGRDHAQVYG